MKDIENQNEADAGRSVLSAGLGVTVDELRELCKLTIQLTKLWQNECKHLCIENIAPDILRKLLSEIRNHKRGFNHYSDCAIHNEPAYPNGECNCGVTPNAELS